MTNITNKAARVESGCDAYENRTTDANGEANIITEDAESTGETNVLTVGGEEAGTTSNTVDGIRALIGLDAVLLPIPSGEKGPRLNGWQETKLERMTDPAYLRQLEAGNIGVLLGSASNGLCAIDIDAQDQALPFLELNPRLLGSLVTKGKRGCQIWVKTQGEYPKLTSLKTNDVTSRNNHG